MSTKKTTRLKGRMQRWMLPTTVIIFTSAVASALVLSNGMPASNVLGHPSLDQGSAPYDPSCYPICRYGGTTGANGIAEPRGVAYDRIHNRVFLADFGNGRVLVYDLYGGIQNGMAAVYELGWPDMSGGGWDISGAPYYGRNAKNPAFGCTTDVNACGMLRPDDVAYDEVNDRLFVLDDGNSRVMVYELSNGITNGMPAAHVLGQPNLQSGPAPGANYHTAANTQNAAFGCTTQVNACGLEDAFGLGFDSQNQRLFVADSYNHRVMIWELAGGITDGMPAAHVLGQPNLQTGNDDRINNGNLYRDTMNPAFGCTTQPNACGMAVPMDVVYDNVHQRLFVSQYSRARVSVFDLSNGITDGMPAVNVLGQTAFSQNVLGNTASNFWAPSYLDYDPVRNLLYANDWLNYRTSVFDVSSITNGEPAITVLGQPSFGPRLVNAPCGVRANGTTNACSYGGGEGGIAVDYMYDRVFGVDSLNDRMIIFGDSPVGVPVTVNGGPDVTTSLQLNPDGSTTVTITDTNVQNDVSSYQVTLPQGTTPLSGASSVVITVDSTGLRTAVLIDAILPPGATKAVSVDISSATGSKVCIKDTSGAQFGGSECSGGTRVSLPAAGSCATVAVNGDLGDNPSNPSDPLGLHNVALCLSSNGQTISLDSLLHTAIEVWKDSDQDGALDADDLCSGTNLAGPVPSSGLRPNHMGDDEVIYGCNASQILACKPGNNIGETKFGLTPGTQSVFAAQSDWAANCQ
ncbi:MAG: hypothetical protein WCT10_05630 [Patescibacteria group bacterium]|jgi:hypothetical protein